MSHSCVGAVFRLRNLDQLVPAAKHLTFQEVKAHVGDNVFTGPTLAPAPPSGFCHVRTTESTRLWVFRKRRFEARKCVSRICRETNSWNQLLLALVLISNAGAATCVRLVCAIRGGRQDALTCRMVTECGGKVWRNWGRHVDRLRLRGDFCRFVQRVLVLGLAEVSTTAVAVLAHLLAPLSLTCVSIGSAETLTTLTMTSPVFCTRPATAYSDWRDGYVTSWISLPSR